MVSSVWAEELCLSLTVCLCEFREAGAESVGTGEEGFLGDSRSATPSLNQTLREGFVGGGVGVRLLRPRWEPGSEVAGKSVTSM